MCLAALCFTKIKKLVFGISLEDISSKKIKIDLEYLLSKSLYKFEVIKNFMEDECRNLY